MANNNAHISFANLSRFKTKYDSYLSTVLEDYVTKSDVSAALKYKGTKATYAELPATGQEVGDVWNITTADPTHDVKAGDNVAWTGTEWDVLSGVVDLSGYVEKETGKGLSTEDYTTAEKTKLSGIEDGAEVNVIETVKVDGTALTVTDKAVNIDLSGKVDKVTGKGLSTNDFTDAYKQAIDDIEFATDSDIDGLFA